MPHKRQSPHVLLVDTLRGRLVVSCQAAAESPLAPVNHIVALARAAEIGGAVGLRLEGLRNVAAVRAATGLPIIGIVKRSLPPDHAFITTTVGDVDGLSSAGANIIAFDATDRIRPEPARALVAACHRNGRLSMADISTIAEAEAAMAAGADFVSSTLSGYTATSPQLEGPDLELMHELSRRGIPFVAEGRIRTLDEAVAVRDTGALFVVVGGAITRPDDITARFVAALLREPAKDPKNAHSSKSNSTIAPTAHDGEGRRG